MGQPFVVPAQNIQLVIEMLYDYCYSSEYMRSIDWNPSLADDPLMFDISICITLLGGSLPNKRDYHEIN